MTPPTSIRRTLCATLIVSMTALTGCGTGSDSSDDDGQTAQTMQKTTDDLAKNTLPALVKDLGAQVLSEGSSFTSCLFPDKGQSYAADGKFVGEGTTANGGDAAVSRVLRASGLSVQARTDGSVLGTMGDVSILVGAREQSQVGPVRDYEYQHNCETFTAADSTYADHPQTVRYTHLVPPDERYPG